MKIIDIHIPVSSDEIAPSTIKYLQEEVNTKAYLNGTISDLKTSMNKAKISISVNQPISTKPFQIHSINNWIKRGYHSPYASINQLMKEPKKRKIDKD